ncbi:hypothetical protein [Streptomyces sp. NPDC003327]
MGLVALLGGDDGDPPPATASSPAASAPPTDSSSARARAQALAERVAMTPADWGAGYSKGDPYEQDPAGEYEVGQDCKGFQQAARSGTLAAVNRTVRNSRSTLTSNTEVRVFVDAETAEAYVDGAEETTRRCPTQQFEKVRWSSVRQATAPEVAGLDRTVAEEGTQTADASGATTDYPYVFYTGRTGDTVVSVLVYETPDNAAALGPRARGVLQKLQQRVASARASATP